MTIPSALPSMSKMYGRLAERNGRLAGEAISPIVVSRFQTPLGQMLVGATDKGLCLLEFEDRRLIDTQVARLEKWFDAPVVAGGNRHTEAVRSELEEYFSGRLKCFTVPLLHPGTGFQVAAWTQLLAIPYGETISYQQQARSMGRPGAQRAVGKANGDNRLAIVIPCHRVVRQNGDLCGYGGGLWRKEFLIDLEKQHRGAGPEAL